MDVAVTDACIFIDLHELQIVHDFFGLNLSVHTTFEVINELYPHQRDVLKAYIAVSKLKIHILKNNDWIEIAATQYPKGLSNTDRTVLHIARKINAMVLSSDKQVRTVARNLSIEYHGLLWILDKLVEQKLIQPQEAIKKIEQLLHKNLLYQNNKDLVSEIAKRKVNWSKL